MDVYHQNAVAVPGGQVAASFQPEKAPFPASSSLPADFFPGENEEGSDDANLQWLSMFMEDCLSTTPSYTTTTTTTTKTNQLPRAKRTKLNPRTEPKASGSDPVLLVHQTHWLAESELLFPVSNGHGDKKIGDQVEEQEKRVKRCSHCHSHKTPQWRAGPMGPKTLCNACGVRFKSGRLLPEYRPAKSPTFVSYKHSNSHKKVMEMRMMAPPSSSSSIIHNN